MRASYFVQVALARLMIAGGFGAAAGMGGRNLQGGQVARRRMNRMIRGTTPFLAALLLLLFGGQVAVGQTGSDGGSSVRADDVAEIKAAFLNRQDTFNARDLPGQLRLFADHITFNTATGKLSVSGKEDYGLLLLLLWDRRG